MVNRVIVNRRTLTSNGTERRYTEVLPDSPRPGAPVVLFLHGSLQSGSVARNFTGNTFDEFADRGCVVLYPDGVGRHFNDHRVGFQERARRELVDDTAFLTTLISHYETDRVIGCGFSNGGQMVQRFALERPGVLSGIACFGSPWPTADNVLPELRPLYDAWSPTPVLSIQGTADPLVPYDGGMSGIGDANRGQARAALDSARFFATLNGLGEDAEPVSAQPVSGVRVDRFGPGAPGSPAVDAASGAAPVELWTIEGMGHLVPNPKQMSDKLGPGTDKVVGAEIVANFFGP